MSKIKRVSLFFRVLFQFVFIAYPILLISCWINAPEPLTMLAHVFEINVIPRAYSSKGIMPILHTLSVNEKLMGFFVSLVPLAIELFVLHCLIKLFRLYERGEIFSLNNVTYIKNIGYALLLGQLINPFYQGIMGVVLTMRNPPGHRYAGITFDQTNLGIVLTALLVILISWVMAEGCRLREEQQLTI